MELCVTSNLHRAVEHVQNEQKWVFHFNRQCDNNVRGMYTENYVINYTW